jgi:hypothetical protein
MTRTIAYLAVSGLACFTAACETPRLDLAELSAVADSVTQRGAMTKSCHPDQQDFLWPRGPVVICNGDVRDTHVILGLFAHDSQAFMVARRWRGRSLSPIEPDPQVTRRLTLRYGSPARYDESDRPPLGYIWRVPYGRVVLLVTDSANNQELTVRADTSASAVMRKP